MYKSKLDHPHVKKEVGRQIASGESQTSIADYFGVHQSTISRFAQKSDIREIVEQEQERLVEAVPDAVQNVKDLIQGMKSLAGDDIRGKELAYKATKDLLKTVGLMPSSINSQTVFNMFQDNSNNISPELVHLLLGNISECTLAEEDIIDLGELD